jgi:hypothetical protein
MSNLYHSKKIDQAEGKQLDNFYTAAFSPIVKNPGVWKGKFRRV